MVYIVQLYSHILTLLKKGKNYVYGKHDREKYGWQRWKYRIMFQSTHEILTKEPLIGKTLLLSDYKNSSNDRSLNLTRFKVYSSSPTYWDTTHIDWILLCFSSVPPGKCSDSISITLGLFPSRSFQIYSPGILPSTLNSIRSKPFNHWRHKIQRYLG